MYNLDLSQATNKGELKPQDKKGKTIAFRTICWDCQKRGCHWLLDGVAYPGSEYYWQYAPYYDTGDKLITIVKCPEAV